MNQLFTVLAINVVGDGDTCPSTGHCYSFQQVLLQAQREGVYAGRSCDRLAL